MRRYLVILLSLLPLCQTASLNAAEVTPLQLFYLVRQAFPEQQAVSVLITKNDFEKVEAKITRATAQMKLKATVHTVDSSADVGKALKKVPKSALLIIFDNAMFTSSKTKLYILSKCKDKRNLIVTSSKTFFDSGALLCIYTDENKQMKIALNLQKNADLKAQFTEEVIQKIGIGEVVM